MKHVSPGPHYGGELGGTVEYKVQTEVNFWVDFVKESCELLAVDGCI